MPEAAWKIAAFVLVAAVLLSSYGALYFYQQVSDLQSQNGYLRSKLGAVSETVDVAFDFGNGTTTWYNATYVPVGCSVFNATFIAAGGRVTTQVYSFGNATGIFVTGILGVQQTSSAYWLWYYYDASSHRWLEADVGAEASLAVQGGVYLWNLTSG